MAPDFTFWTYDSTRDGQLLTATANYYSPWFDVTGIKEINITGTFTGGTTQVFVEQNREGPAGDGEGPVANPQGALMFTTADIKATVVGNNGETIKVPHKFARIRINQTVANTTIAHVAAKGAA